MHLGFDSHHTSTAVKLLHGPAYLAEAEIVRSMSKHFSSELNRECVSWDPLPFKTHCPQVLRIRRKVGWGSSGFSGIQWILWDPLGHQIPKSLELTNCRESCVGCPVSLRQTSISPAAAVSTTCLGRRDLDHRTNCICVTASCSSQ